MVRSGRVVPVAAGILALACTLLLAFLAGPAAGVYLPDPQKCAGRTALLEHTGTAGRDKLVGTPGPDVIWGGGGVDQIFGEGGADVICGGPGNDFIVAGAGNDRIVLGESGKDRAYGGSGNDKLSGGLGADSLHGGEGGDIILGGGQADGCHGNEGRDRCDGGAPSPSNPERDADICAKDVEKKLDCRKRGFPRAWSLVANGTAKRPGGDVTETWSAVIDLPRFSQSDDFASYRSTADGLMHWSIGGQDDDGCTYSREADIPARGDLALFADRERYALEVNAGGGSLEITVDCPSTPPQTQSFTPLAYPQPADADLTHYDPEETTIAGHRAYDGDPENPPFVAIDWNWELTAQGR